MLISYLKAAMSKAHYEILPTDGGYYGEITDFPGVWANASTLEKCREELEEVLEEWILLGLTESRKLPIVDGLELAVRRAS